MFSTNHKLNPETNITLYFTAVGENLVYKFNAIISCVKTTDPHTIKVTFKNSMKQEKIATLDVPVIYGN